VLERIRKHEGVMALAILCLAAGLALLLAFVYHLGVPAMLSAMLLGLPGLFLAWRAVPRTGGALTTPDIGHVFEQLSRAIDERGKSGSVWLVSLSPRPEVLAGRDSLLAELQAMLAEGERPWPRTVVLCGLGGVGKTSIAAKYVHRHLGEVGVAWQVAAEDPVVLAADLAELAAQLGVRRVGDPRDPVASVHGALASFSTEWLLIFDNAPDEMSVLRLLPPVGRGRTLVTSQSAM
jgi:hypothetical protein